MSAWSRHPPSRRLDTSAAARSADGMPASGLAAVQRFWSLRSDAATAGAVRWPVRQPAAYRWSRRG
ncbi:MAG TPA: hypothetical protein VFB06_04230 [Streptosporangiaceae bacterium]|nr:hypothetical protein [Streptosporangiaceae bacterium]